jgi:hypothetical protein
VAVDLNLFYAIACYKCVGRFGSHNASVGTVTIGEGLDDLAAGIGYWAKEQFLSFQNPMRSTGVYLNVLESTHLATQWLSGMFSEFLAVGA